MVVALPDELTIAQVAEFHHELNDKLAAGESIDLDASGVTRIDTAGLQLLLALLRDESSTVTWSEPSAVIQASATRLGIGDGLMV